MKADVLKSVGQSIIKPENTGSCSFSFNKNNFAFRSSIQNKNRDFSLDSNVVNEYGRIISSIGTKNPILTFQPYLGTTFLQISMSGEDFLQLNTQFTQPLIIKQIPFKVHAECINNKSLLSIELAKAFSYSHINGIIFMKYGKSLDFDIDVTFPYCENHFLVNSSQILFNTSLGIHNSQFIAFPYYSKFISPYLSSFFVTYRFISDYLINTHQIGCYIRSKQKCNLFSILYNLNQKEINMKAEANIHNSLSLASHVDIKSSDLAQFNITNLQIGTSFLTNDRFNSKYNLQFKFPDYIAIAKLQAKLNQTFHTDLSTSYNFHSKSFEFGINLAFNSNE